MKKFTTIASAVVLAGIGLAYAASSITPTNIADTPDVISGPQNNAYVVSVSDLQLSWGNNQDLVYNENLLSEDVEIVYTYDTVDKDNNIVTNTVTFTAPTSLSGQNDNSLSGGDYIINILLATAVGTITDVTPETNTKFEEDQPFDILGNYGKYTITLPEKFVTNAAIDTNNEETFTFYYYQETVQSNADPKPTVPEGGATFQNMIASLNNDDFATNPAGSNATYYGCDTIPFTCTNLDLTHIGQVSAYTEILTTVNGTTTKVEVPVDYVKAEVIQVVNTQTNPATTYSALTLDFSDYDTFFPAATAEGQQWTFTIPQGFIKGWNTPTNEKTPVVEYFTNDEFTITYNIVKPALYSVQSSPIDFTINEIDPYTAIPAGNYVYEADLNDYTLTFNQNIQYVNEEKAYAIVTFDTRAYTLNVANGGLSILNDNQLYLNFDGIEGEDTFYGEINVNIKAGQITNGYENNKEYNKTFFILQDNVSPTVTPVPAEGKKYVTTQQIANGFQMEFNAKTFETINYEVSYTNAENEGLFEYLKNNAECTPRVAYMVTMYDNEGNQIDEPVEIYATDLETEEPEELTSTIWTVSFGFPTPETDDVVVARYNVTTEGYNYVINTDFTDSANGTGWDFYVWDGLEDADYDAIPEWSNTDVSFTLNYNNFSTIYPTFLTLWGTAEYTPFELYERTRNNELIGEALPISWNDITFETRPFDPTNNQGIATQGLVVEGNVVSIDLKNTLAEYYEKKGTSNTFALVINEDVLMNIDGEINPYQIIPFEVYPYFPAPAVVDATEEDYIYTITWEGLNFIAPTNKAGANYEGPVITTDNGTFTLPQYDGEQEGGYYELLQVDENDPTAGMFMSINVKGLVEKGESFTISIEEGLFYMMDENVDPEYINDMIVESFVIGFDTEALNYTLDPEDESEVNEISSIRIEFELPNIDITLSRIFLEGEYANGEYANYVGTAVRDTRAMSEGTVYNITFKEDPMAPTETVITVEGQYILSISNPIVENAEGKQIAWGEGITATYTVKPSLNPDEPEDDIIYVIGAFNDWTASDDYVLYLNDESEATEWLNTFYVPAGQFDFYLDYRGMKVVPAEGEGLVTFVNNTYNGYIDANESATTYWNDPTWNGGQITISTDGDEITIYAFPDTAIIPNYNYTVDYDEQDFTVYIEWSNADYEGVWFVTPGAYLLSSTGVVYELANYQFDDIDYGVSLNIESLNVPEGAYTLIIPEGCIQVVSGGWEVWDEFNPYIEFNFVYDSTTGINGINAGENVDVYTINGVQVLKNANADALRTLENGLYIINGKKVVIRK